MKRIPPKQLSNQITKIIKKQRPDANYLKKVFEYVRRNLDLKGQQKKGQKLPELLTEDEMKRFYESVWNSAKRAHLVMVKMLLFTGMRNSELANLKLSDVDLKDLKVRIDQGKGKNDRYVPIPSLFRGELAQYISIQKEKGAVYLFETNRLDKMSTRWVREIVKKYALDAGITKKIYPHLFRHQLFTYLTKKGIIDTKLQLISGHKAKHSLAIYQNLSLADVEAEYNEAMKDFPIK